MVSVSRLVASKVLALQYHGSGTLLLQPLPKSLLHQQIIKQSLFYPPCLVYRCDNLRKVSSGIKADWPKRCALDQALILTHLGRHAFDESLARLKLLGYFAYLEEEYETIVYICDTQFSLIGHQRASLKATVFCY